MTNSYICVSSHNDLKKTKRNTLKFLQIYFVMKTCRNTQTGIVHRFKAQCLNMTTHKTLKQRKTILLCEAVKHHTIFMNVTASARALNNHPSTLNIARPLE